MPYLRYKRWKYATPLLPHTVRCQSGRRYLWNGTEEGVVVVPYQADVEFLLNPLGDRQSEYEVVWERHGVRFHHVAFTCLSCQTSYEVGAEISESTPEGVRCHACPSLSAPRTDARKSPSTKRLDSPIR